MVASTSIPVTVKIRTGWDSDSINAPEVTRIAEAAGAKIISIHGRTRQQKYTGKANWDHIRECKKAAKSILVIGNGDIFDASSVQTLFKQSNCDGILVSRGTFGQPWIAENIKRLDKNLSLLNPSIQNHLLEHMKYIFSYQSKRKALLDMRRIGCWYLRNGKGTKKLRDLLNRAQNLSEVENLIKDYDWSQTSFD